MDAGADRLSTQSSDGGGAADKARVQSTRPPERRSLLSLAMLAASFLSSIVLLVYPWLEWWEENRFAAWLPIWNSGYLRGALAGLGAISLALSLSSMSYTRKGRR